MPPQFSPLDSSLWVTSVLSFSFPFTETLLGYVVNIPYLHIFKQGSIYSFCHLFFFYPATLLKILLLRYPCSPTASSGRFSFLIWFSLSFVAVDNWTQYILLCFLPYFQRHLLSFFLFVCFCFCYFLLKCLVLNCSYASPNLQNNISISQQAISALESTFPWKASTDSQISDLIWRLSKGSLCVCIIHSP